MLLTLESEFRIIIGTNISFFVVYYYYYLKFQRSSPWIYIWTKALMNNIVSAEDPREKYRSLRCTPPPPSTAQLQLLSERHQDRRRRRTWTDCDTSPESFKVISANMHRWRRRGRSRWTLINSAEAIAVGPKLKAIVLGLASVLCLPFTFTSGYNVKVGWFVSGVVLLVHPRCYRIVGRMTIHRRWCFKFNWPPPSTSYTQSIN